MKSENMKPPPTNENTVIPLYKMQLLGLFSLKLTYHSVLWRSCIRFPVLGGRDSYESLPFPRYRWRMSDNQFHNGRQHYYDKHLYPQWLQSEAIITLLSPNNILFQINFVRFTILKERRIINYLSKRMIELKRPIPNSCPCSSVL